MAIQLNDTAIAKITADARKSGQRQDVADTREPGLRFRVTPPSQRYVEGTRMWSLACRHEGRMRRFGLGTYPTLGVAEARKSARQLRQALQAGHDPIRETRRRRILMTAAQEGVGTLKHLLDVYGGPAKPDVGANVRPTGPGAHLKSWATGRARIDRVFKGSLMTSLEDLSCADLQLAADAYPARQIAASAVRCLRPVLKWAAARNHVSDAVASLTQPVQVKRRDRVLDHHELARLLPVLKAGGTPHHHALHFMLLTATRREEAAGIRWRDVDSAIGTLRLPETKNGLPHVIPLPRQALGVLAALKCGKTGDLVFATGTGGRLSNWDREAKRIMKASDTSAWTRHDLRRTAATIMGELGVEPHIIEAALNHAVVFSGLAATYNKSRYQKQVGMALQELADRLDTIEAGAVGIEGPAGRSA